MTEQAQEQQQRQLTPVQQMQQMIDKESVRNEIEAVLPKGITIDKFARIAKTAIANNPDLADSDPASLMNSLVRCAQDGLVPDGREAAMVTFDTKVKQGNQETRIKKAQYMPMVDGILKRARMSGEITVIAAKPVYQGDEFDYWMDEEGEHLNYRPQLRGAEDRGALQLVFAFARLANGELVVETMTRDEIEKVRKASKNSDSGPWKDWYDRMALKAVLHRHARRLPNASEVMELTGRDSFMYDFEQSRDVTPQREALPDAEPALTDDQRDQIEKGMEMLDIEQGEIFRRLGISALDELTQGRADRAIRWINAKLDEQQAEAEQEAEQ
jgi:recombination protein RecT